MIRWDGGVNAFYHFRLELAKGEAGGWYRACIIPACYMTLFMLSHYFGEKKLQCRFYQINLSQL